MGAAQSSDGSPLVELVETKDFRRVGFDKLNQPVSMVERAQTT